MRPLDLHDPSQFGYGRATLRVPIADHTYALAALDGFERNVAPVYRALAGRRTPQDPGDWLPMFGVLWPGARALARSVAQHTVAGQRVIELGCGLALPSLVAARHGAKALATDNHPHAGAFLRANAAHNGVEVAYRHLDWRDLPPDLGRFDRVVASDLLFSPELAPLVAEVIAATLDPQGEAWLVDPGRLALDTFEAAASAQGLGLDLEIFEEDNAELYRLILRW
ncbi:MAG: methyltransferase domain-containing protein [Deltaproteobacteria bacterium]|nr:MAG: methyltransferase domain-containing protein [Deltaproteobacteria bacterium]